MVTTAAELAARSAQYFAEYPVPSGCVHVMVEVDSMTEVGRAHDRLRAHEGRLSATLGQHLNDRMTSFYMKTPSGFV